MVIFSLKPGIKYDEKLLNFDFTFNEHDGTKRAIISRIIQKISNHDVQTGLFFRVYINAENVLEAKERAKGFIDGVIGLMSFTSGVGLPIPEEILAYEITPNATKREFLQVFYNPTNVAISRKKIDHKFFQRFTDQIYKLDESSYHRIARALRWYRLGALTFDIFDKFSCYWTGIEALNPLLQRKLGATNEVKKIKCENCGSECIVNNLTVSGIKCFLIEKIQKPQLYKDFHEVRVKLVHSTCELSTVGQKVSELVPILAETLFRAVCFSLDFQDWADLPYKEPLQSVPIRLELEGKLLGDYSGNLGFDGRDPYLESNHNVMDISFEKNGDITFTINSDMKVRIEPFKTFQLTETRLYGDRETKGSFLKFKKNGEEINPSSSKGV